MIFHLANAAMLPLVGQKLTLQDKNQGTALMSACIVAAQAVMVPMAMLVGRKADVWGRKPLFLAGFAILSLRGFLYPLSDDRYWLFFGMPETRDLAERKPDQIATAVQTR